MEKYKLQEEVQIFCVTASSFPESIREAFESLHRMLPSTKDRTFYGISYLDDKGAIIYKAAVAETFAGEAKNMIVKAFS